MLYHHMMKACLPCLFSLLTGWALLASCSDNASPMPSYREDLVCLHTDASGVIGEMRCDDGQTYRVSNVKGGLRPDSTYRALALFTHEAGSDAVWLTDYASILAPRPMKFRNNVVRDPLSVVSCWKSGGYVNLRLQLKGTNGVAHYFGFHEADEHTNPAGGKTVSIQLIHHQNQDPLYYTRELYLSLPLDSYVENHTGPTDSIEVNVVTFSGDYVRRFSLGHGAES